MRLLWFPTRLPLGGIHIRHGDKKIDGWTPRSMDDELAALGAGAENAKIAPVEYSFAGYRRIALDAYVASDDSKVLKRAAELGLMSSSPGVSQSIGDTGVETVNYLSDKNSIAMRYSAALEIISDVFYLSQCSTLVGTASSQIFRMSADMSNASGILREAIIMDFKDLTKIVLDSSYWNLPVSVMFIEPSVKYYPANCTFWKQYYNLTLYRNASDILPPLIRRPWEFLKCDEIIAKAHLIHA